MVYKHRTIMHVQPGGCGMNMIGMGGGYERKHVGRQAGKHVTP